MFAVRMGPGISLLQKCSANNLSIDHLLSNTHGPCMYTLSMDPHIHDDRNTITTP